ncbi:MAG: penicillin-binding transpeptidase domain-containing protein [Anaerovoracaceae bacterium]
MKKLEKRAVICLLLAGLLLVGLLVFAVRFVINGEKWATSTVNLGLYRNGRLAVGRIYDRNDKLLADNTKKNIKFSKNKAVRLATAQTVGDAKGYVSTSAESALRDRLVGYNLLTGVYSATGKGNDVKLSIDSRLCAAAYRAMGSNKGFAAVYNYKTGEILCMVSTPTYDPKDPPSISTAESGTFMNKFLSGTFTPGSTFKLVTAGAALENDPDYVNSFSYTCTGARSFGSKSITCHDGAHGKESFEDALANSCNTAFSVIADHVGASALSKFTKNAGLTKSYDMSGIKCAKGSFQFPSNAPMSLGWAGIGQWKDLVNPCSFMVYIGSIANGGKAVQPRILASSTGISVSAGTTMSEDSASQLKEMMRNNVTSEYGESRFPGLNVCAKTGTAQAGGTGYNSWFVGFLDDDDHPYAFEVCLEHSTSGITGAAPVANTILQKAVSLND